MQYTPETPPKFDDLEKMSQWVLEELQKVSGSQAETIALELRETHREPERPREGMMVFADGTDWDPGDSRGGYIYRNGLWMPFAAGRWPTNVRQFGAKGDGVTDDTASIQAALDYVRDSGGGWCFAPRGQYPHTGLRMSGQGVNFIGESLPTGSASSNGTQLIYTGSTGNWLTVEAPNFKCSVQYISLLKRSTETPTNGTALEWTDTGFTHGYINFVDVDNCWNGFDINTTNVFIMEKCRAFPNMGAAFGFKWRAPLGARSDVMTMHSCVVRPFGQQGSSQSATLEGFHFDGDVNSLNMLHCGVSHTNNGFRFTQQGSTAVPGIATLLDCVCEFANNHGFHLADIRGIDLQNCYANSNDVNGIRIGDNVVLAKVLGGIINGNGQHGLMLLDGAKETMIANNWVMGNGQDTVNTYDGIHVEGGTTHFSIEGNRCGGSIVTYGSTGVGQQRYGINVSTGASDNYMIHGNRARYNGTGGINDGGTGVNKIVADNLV